MARQRKNLSPVSSDELALEITAVLEANAESTDGEICDLMNSWLNRRCSEYVVKPSDISNERARLQIPPTDRRPFQKDLFG